LKGKPDSFGISIFSVIFSSSFLPSEESYNSIKSEAICKVKTASIFSAIVSLL
jgi:hypothetical protein